jgi:hypothetical protein
MDNFYSSFYQFNLLRETDTTDPARITESLGLATSLLKTPITLPSLGVEA